MFRFFDDFQLVVTTLFEPHHIFVKHDECPGVGRSLSLLPVVECVSIPVSQLLAFTDFLMENVRVDFLQAKVFDAQVTHQVLQVDEVAWRELLAPFQG